MAVATVATEDENGASDLSPYLSPTRGEEFPSSRIGKGPGVRSCPIFVTML